MEQRTDDDAHWLPVDGYEGLYEVSEYGLVWSAPRATTSGGLLKQFPDRHGYPHVTLTRNGSQKRHAVHILVARAFIGPCPDGQEVCHEDGDPARPHASNLRYDTHGGNMLDRRRHGTDPNAAKEKCPAGHDYTPDNTDVRQYPNGPRRFCLKCRKIKARARYEADKAAGKPTWKPNSELTPEQLERRRETSKLRQRRYQARLRAPRQQSEQDH